MILTLVFSLAPLTLGSSDAYGASKAKTQQDKVIAIAMANLGKGAGAFGFGGGGWCTKYVNWSMKKAGLSNGTNYPTDGLGASRDFAVHYAKKGAYTALYKNSSGNVGYDTVVDYDYIPKKGDIAIFARSKGSSLNHVGLVSSVVLNSKGKPKYVKIVHGNWSGRVSYTTFNAYGGSWGSEILGYATPNYTLNVTLNPNGGEVSKTSINALKGQKYGKLPTPEREGYQFLGWYTAKQDGKRVKSSTKVSFSESHILYAHWASLDEEVTDEDPDDPNADESDVTDESADVDVDDETEEPAVPELPDTPADEQ
jgi:uncharacterized repeat protein (TIGR02543 family)